MTETSRSFFVESHLPVLKRISARRAARAGNPQDREDAEVVPRPDHPEPECLLFLGRGLVGPADRRALLLDLSGPGRFEELGVGAMPRFIVTDHGPQFLKRFGKLVSRPKTRGVRCRVPCFKLNGKVERLFRTFKAWARLKLFAWFEDRKRIARRMQGRLDVFRDWYNTARPNQAVSGLTPEEAWRGAALPEAEPVLAHDDQPVFDVKRRKYRGDPQLPVFDIAVEWPEAA